MRLAGGLTILVRVKRVFHATHYVVGAEMAFAWHVLLPTLGTSPVWTMESLLAKVCHVRFCHLRTPATSTEEEQPYMQQEVKPDIFVPHTQGVGGGFLYFTLILFALLIDGSISRMATRRLAGARPFRSCASHIRMEPQRFISGSCGVSIWCTPASSG